MRFLTYHYPFLPFRSRLFPWTNSWDSIPREGVLKTHYGIQIRSIRDAMYRSIFHFGDYEPYNTKIYRRLINEGDTVLDIGANFGWYSSLFAKWVGENGMVHAFEPVPFIYQYARDNLALNHCEDRVSLNCFGLGRGEGGFTVYTFSGLPHGHATATNLGRDDAVPHLCRIESLDRYAELKGIRNCAFLKIDVEGHESEVFEGGEAFLSAENAPIISFEINSECLSNRGKTADTTISVLRAAGYDNFFSFSIRQGVLPIDTVPSGINIDCLAFKKARRDQALKGLKARRLLR